MLNDYNLYDLGILVISTLVIAVLLFLRTNVALAILGLCAGYVFSDLFVDSLSGFLYRSGYSGGSLPIESIVSLVLIGVPALLIILRFRHYQKGRYIQHTPPAIGFVLLSLTLIFNNLPFNTQNFLLEKSYIFQLINQYELAIIAVVVVLSVVDVMLFELERNKKMKRLKKRGKKRHKD